MKSYVIVQAIESADLENKVNELIQQGYILVGGIAKGYTVYYQAMYKAP